MRVFVPDAPKTPSDLKPTKYFFFTQMRPLITILIPFWSPTKVSQIKLTKFILSPKGELIILFFQATTAPSLRQTGVVGLISPRIAPTVNTFLKNNNQESI